MAMRERIEFDNPKKWTRLYERPGYAISTANRRVKFWAGSGQTRKVVRLQWVIREIGVVLAKGFPRGKTTKIYRKTSSELSHHLNRESTSKLVDSIKREQQGPQYNAGGVGDPITSKTILIEKALIRFHKFTKHQLWVM